jgi:hypothetical protein
MLTRLAFAAGDNVGELTTNGYEQQRTHERGEALTYFNAYN